jgi:hypothetical protein
VAPRFSNDARKAAPKLGVQPHIVEAVLNHVSGHKAGVAGVYNRAAYAKEKPAALELWAKHVDRLVSAKSREKAAHAVDHDSALDRHGRNRGDAAKAG